MAPKMIIGIAVASKDLTKTLIGFLALGWVCL
jgi:hypothetical protein